MTAHSGSAPISRHLWQKFRERSTTRLVPITLGDADTTRRITVLPAHQVANSGTRFMLALSEIPAGVDVYVAIHDHRRVTDETVAGPNVQLIQTRSDMVLLPSQRPHSTLISSHGVELIRLDVSEGNAVAVWEWVSSEPILLNSVRKAMLDVVFATSKGALVGTGIVVATVLLAPQSYERETDSLPVPCFGVGRAEINLLSIE